MTLNSNDVLKIANLARIHVTPEEQELLAQQLSNILDMMKQLNQIDTTGVEPLTSVAKQKLPRRADDITDGGYAADLLANGPDVMGDFFVVPKVIE